MPFILSAQVYYTGHAGPAWVSADKSKALDFSEGEALRKANAFNEKSAVHGLVFKAVELPPTPAA